MQDEVYKDAAELARLLHAEHWPENTGWSPLGDTRGVLSQISNMCVRMRDQKAEIERLRAALREIADMDDPAISAQQVAADALEGKDASK